MQGSERRRLIIQFAKEPVEGKVKTRLLSGFKPSETVDLHCELVSVTAEALLASEAEERQLHIAGNLRHPFLTPFEAQGFTLIQQVEGDLGQKMLAALNKGLEEFEQVILVGSDCPAISPVIIESAFSALDNECRLVLNAAEDGGYVLIGCNHRLPDALFDQVNWGSKTVLSETLSNAASLGLQVRLLPELWDVDYPEDVSRWRRWQYQQDHII
ncbi:TIGR04282 family arsenosugar biosynthesis glycosyltransferase [Oceanospirillum sp.]|uniref:TIGR04282 family arsenosugar biosynthesis glycosyltransferase n=1 Tax=Oceanospirillum sp. TaxID=2021254 RepID=UPI003A95D012